MEGAEQKIKLLLQIIGYLCSTLTAAKKSFILLGKPNSGKSQVLKLIEFIVGEENICNIQLEKLGDRFSAAALNNKLLNVCGELSARPIRDIEKFKMIVGGDTLTGENKGQPLFQFKCKCRLLFAGNMLPPIKNEDFSSAFVDRIVILNFPREIPREERDYELLDHLIDESDVIFSLAMKELRELVQNNFSFEIPDDSKEILADYSFQPLHIDTFVEEHCELGEEFRIHTRDAYAEYKNFCRQNMVNPISEALFSQKLCCINGVRSSRFRIDGSQSLRGFCGIKLKDDTIRKIPNGDTENDNLKSAGTVERLEVNTNDEN